VTSQVEHFALRILYYSNRVGEGEVGLILALGGDNMAALESPLVGPFSSSLYKWAWKTVF